jgi:hypothetical protein
MLMISLNFAIRNPWSNEFKSLGVIAYETVFKHKYIEIEAYKDSSIVSFSFNWTIRQSHAGVMIDVGLFGYNVQYQFYDNRHWNTEEGRWMFYTEEDGMH